MKTRHMEMYSQGKHYDEALVMATKKNCSNFEPPSKVEVNEANAVDDLVEGTSCNTEVSPIKSADNNTTDEDATAITLNSSPKRQSRIRKNINYLKLSKGSHSEDSNNSNTLEESKSRTAQVTTPVKSKTVDKEKSNAASPNKADSEQACTETESGSEVNQTSDSAVFESAGNCNATDITQGLISPIIKERGTKKTVDSIISITDLPLITHVDNKESSELNVAPKKIVRKRKIEKTPLETEFVGISIKSEGQSSPIDGSYYLEDSNSCNTTAITENLTSPIVKKRGRKKKVDNVVINTEFPSITNVYNEESFEDEIVATPVLPKKRGRKRKSDQVLPEIDFIDEPREARNKKTINYLELSGLDCENEAATGRSKKLNRSFDAPLSGTAQKRKRKSMDNTANAILMSSLVAESNLLSPQVSQVQGGAKIDGVHQGRQKTGDSDGTLYTTCAICNKEVLKVSWSNHKQRYHNNMAWKVDEEPLDLDNPKKVLAILTDLYKRKKPLYCEICGVSKKSVVGYLSHKSVCSKESENKEAVKVKCEFCERTMLPVSLPMHFKYCRVYNKEKYASEEITVQDSNNSTAVSGKRQAAKKALNMINSIKNEDKSVSISRQKKYWIENYDFEVTTWAQNCISKTIADKSFANCCFDECNYTSADALEIFNHFQTCDKKPTENCVCKLCLKTLKQKDDILQHLNTDHGKSLKIVEDDEFQAGEMNNVEENDNSDYENDCKDFEPIGNPAAATKVMSVLDAQTLKRNPIPNSVFYYSIAAEWATKFCKTNYSTENLFPKWKICKSEKLKPNLIMNYLPLCKYSVCTAEMEVTKSIETPSDYNWKRYKLFETSASNNVSTIFCGGPISTTAWLPTPYNRPECEQILAVAVLHDPNKEYLLNESYSDYGLIQFWNCGALRSSTLIQPKLEFGIAHNHNPIWCMEWCPSGCYNVSDPNSKRLGLLAVGCGDSQIYIYSVYLPNSSGKVFQVKPVVKLSKSIVNSTTNSTTAVTKLSWTKAVGHKYLAAGYGNGMVAIFNLETSSSLLKMDLKDSEIKTILPYKVLSCHSHAITALSLYHLNEGCRWMMTGSLDRSVKYWDLHNASSSLSGYLKFPVIDGLWLNHWMSAVHCIDYFTTQGTGQTYVSQIRNIKADHISPILFSNSTVLSVSGSEWTNGFLQGNEAGEISVIFANNLYCGLDVDRLRRKRVMLSCTHLVEKNVSNLERLKKEQGKQKNQKKTQKATDPSLIKTLLADVKPLSFEESEQRFGLVFSNFNMVNKSQFVERSKKLKTFNLSSGSPDAYPLQAVKKVEFNPNKSAFEFIATGYQAGFVRICKLQFLEPLTNR